jgi:hypothetical protein
MGQIGRDNERTDSHRSCVALLQQRDRRLQEGRIHRFHGAIGLACCHLQLRCCLKIIQTTRCGGEDVERGGRLMRRNSSTPASRSAISPACAAAAAANVLASSDTRSHAHTQNTVHDTARARRSRRRRRSDGAHHW